MKNLHSIIRSARQSSVKNGSALLIAILVMAILITLTLGLSDLVIREIRQTTDLVSSGKAYFSAEAGVENALLDLHENLPGYETQNPADPNDKYLPLQDAPTGLNARYRILSKADSTYNNVPSFDSDRPIFLQPTTNEASNTPTNVATNVGFAYTDKAEATYNSLLLSESVVIPLYSVDQNNTPQKVENFLIEYYVAFDQANAPQQSGIPASDFRNLDILRWKVFGKPDPGLGGDPSKTDAISDFFPAAIDSSANIPMCIGTDQSLQPTGKDQGCTFPVLASDSVNTSGSLWGAARECYLSDSGIKGQLSDIQTAQYGGCTIQNFIQNHIQNYLVLTNVINPDVLLRNQNLTTAEAKAHFTIHYRIIAKPGPSEPKLVRQAADISADGYAANGQVKQSIDVNINQSSFLPVFNFSLYHTCTKPDPTNPLCPK